MLTQEQMILLAESVAAATRSSEKRIGPFPYGKDACVEPKNEFNIQAPFQMYYGPHQGGAK